MWRVVGYKFKNKGPKNHYFLFSYIPLFLCVFAMYFPFILLVEWSEIFVCICNHMISCTLHFGLNYEMNYQLDAIKYLFIWVLSAPHVSGLHAYLQEQWMLQFLYICSIWCPWFSLVRCQSWGVCVLLACCTASNTPTAHTLLRTDT